MLGGLADDDNGSLSWCLIESDPAVFTELCSEWGVQNVEFREVYGTDEATFAEFQKTTQGQQPLGFIFLFKWVDDREMPEQLPATSVLSEASDKIFFATQVIKNACATFAILSILLNSEGVDIGEVLRELREFACDFDPYMRGLTISNSNKLREAHNSFRMQKAIDVVNSDDTKTQKEDAFHYVAYVPINGRLYELDGLRNGPIDRGECSNGNWVDLARQVVADKIQRVQAASAAAPKSGAKSSKDDSDEIRFALLALTEDQLNHYKLQRISKLCLRSRITESLGEDSRDDRWGCSALESALTDEQLPPKKRGAAVAEADEIILPIHPDELRDMKEKTDTQLSDLHIAISLEEQRKEQSRKENQLRRHNFLPLILASLRHLARRGELLQEYEAAKARHQARKAARETAA